MVITNQTRLWRVEWIHRSGYRAPHYWVEAKIGRNKEGKVDEKQTRRNAVQAAKQKSRLGDFPKTWYCRITDVTPEKDEIVKSRSSRDRS
jgi:hypothetical protein